MADIKPRAESTWSDLAQIHDAIMVVARECANLSLPYMAPPEGFKDGDQLPEPEQDLGARASLNLAAKLLLALLPSSQPFFKLGLDSVVEKDLGDAKEGITKYLAEIEGSVVDYAESSNLRVVVDSCLKSLVVTGNGLLHVPTDQKLENRFIPLSNYRVKRAPDDTLLQLVILEVVAVQGLEDDVKALLDEATQQDANAEVNVYTHIELVDGKYQYYQETNQTVIPGTNGFYVADKMPYLPLRWTVSPNNSYGIGQVQHAKAALEGYSDATTAIKSFQEAASKFLMFVKPTSRHKKKELENAPKGKIFDGHADDISTYKVDNLSDWNIALQSAEMFEKSISYSFLLNSGLQRSGDRVTATELKLLTDELQQQLGGQYSLLANTMQTKLVNLLLIKTKQYDKIPKDLGVSISITTGSSALSRSAQLYAMDEFVSGLIALGIDIKSHINIPNLIQQRAIASGISPDGLVLTQQERVQAKADQMAEQMGPSLISQGMQGMMQGQDPTQQGQELNDDSQNTEG